MTEDGRTPLQRQQHEEYLESIRQRDRQYARLAAQSRAVEIASTKLYLSNPANLARMLPSDVEASKRRLSALLALDIRATRESVGMSQDTLAKLAGVTRPNLTTAEGNEGKPLSIGTLDRIRALLHAKIAEDEGRPYEDYGVQAVLARIDGGASHTTTAPMSPDQKRRARDVLAKPMEDDES